jgi:DNA-binding NarL/FixJ family response regulator
MYGLHEGPASGARARLQVLIADDREIVRRGVRSILESRKEWEICGEASNGRDAVLKAAQLRPDLVILDHADFERFSRDRQDSSTDAKGADTHAFHAQWKGSARRSSSGWSARIRPPSRVR